MVLLSTAIGYALVAAGPLERNLERIAPVLGVLATAFGVWYAVGARGSDLLVLKSDLREPPTGELPRMRQGLLDRVLGLAHTAQYPVGDREQRRPQSSSNSSVRVTPALP